ncbi:sugar (Glycoside-Pentoside-Hexuronide) transporter [Thiorhodovibrio winogradskyi]|uniref:Sugar (Glycoside-Pentoside-Hexuronide) transporter n=1 Tax=Thiorhodovibrio winogradskyi TaxID=77007 RepID=A0ABZ0SEZ2_9GAMM|nr:MFS transporter [Thiorhodovibrio winogradskyi]
MVLVQTETRSPAREVFAWALYDWGNSAFATTVMAGFFPVFYSAISGRLDTEQAQFWFNIALALSSLLIGLSGPLFGVIADRGGWRNGFLAGFASLGIVATAALAWVQNGQWAMALLLYATASIGFAGGNIFYDSLLPHVARGRNMDRVSALGYALGYGGGGLLFALNVAMVLKFDWFGLSDAGAAVRLSFLSVSLWWLVFTLPLLFMVRTRQAREQVPTDQVWAGAWHQLVDTLKAIRAERLLVVFLIAYWLYIDGVNTVIKTAVFFGDRVLGLDQSGLISALLLTQFVALPAALLFGWVGQRIGARAGILIGLGVYLGVIVYAWALLESSRDFYLLAVAIGLVQGGVQSLSRSLFASLIPAHKSAEYFGVFNLVGKFATVLGPLLMALTPLLFVSASPRTSILPLALLFLIGGGLLLQLPHRPQR